MYKKSNSNEFDCPCCGNPLIKNRGKSTIRCVWCRSIVDYNGNVLPSNKYSDRNNKRQTESVNK